MWRPPPAARVQPRAARAQGVTRAGARAAGQAAEGGAGLREAFRAREARLLLLLGCMRSPLLPTGGPAPGRAALALVRLHWCGCTGAVSRPERGRADAR